LLPMRIVCFGRPVDGSVERVALGCVSSVFLINAEALRVFEGSAAC